MLEMKRLPAVIMCFDGDGVFSVHEVPSACAYTTDPPPRETRINEKGEEGPTGIRSWVGRPWHEGDIHVVGTEPENLRVYGDAGAHEFNAAALVLEERGISGVPLHLLKSIAKFVESKCSVACPPDMEANA